jgi:L-methionine (R)-S-oxide reductase
VSQTLLCVRIGIAEGTEGILSFICQRPVAEITDSSRAASRVVAALVSKHLQVERMQVLLRSRMAQMALLKAEQGFLEARKDWYYCPASMGRMLAKSFYKDLRNAGFEPAAVIEVASSIIAHITSDIARHRRRL